MAERDDIEKASSEPAASPEGAPKATETQTPAAETPPSVKRELPAIESPSISPAAPEVVVEPRLETAAAVEGDSPIAPAPKAEAHSGFAFNARHRRNALLAASVAIAAALGAVLGAVAGGGFAKPTPASVDTASLQERKAMQQSIAHLSREIATLKSSVEAANKSAHTQIAKIGDKLNDKITERLSRDRAEVTGSISAPQTATPAPTPAPAPVPAATPAPAPQLTTPMPTPRPAQRTAAEENPPPPPPPAHPPLIAGWSLRAARDGHALLEGHGDIYQVVPGVPVPGLGLVQQIKREDGRWVVVTPRGIVVSLRDRRYFESF